MRTYLLRLVCFTLVSAATIASGQEHRVVKLSEGPATEEIAPAIADLLNDTGFKVVRGTTRTICEIWLCKEWPTKTAKAAGDVIYPLEPGQLIGVIRYPRKASDFRDQDISSGVYTLRYGQQPVDGAHVGTSPTRDFLLVLPAERDQSAEPLDYKPLTAASKETAGSSHPAILSLQRLSESTEPLSIRHNEEKDWWIVRFVGKISRDGKKQDQPLELVVVGHADE